MKKGPDQTYISQTLHVCHICLHWGGWGVNVGIYMAYMECLGMTTLAEDITAPHSLKSIDRRKVTWLPGLRLIRMQETTIRLD